MVCRWHWLQLLPVYLLGLWSVREVVGMAGSFALDED